MQALLDLYSDEGPERVGFLMPDGEIVEVGNVAADPTQGFDVSGADLMRYAMRATASWHTHPGEPANLSTRDYESFLAWPGLEHFIIGCDGIAHFYIEDGEVIAVEDD